MTHQEPTPSPIVEPGQIATRFEDQWKSGSRPRIVDFVSITPKQARHAVLLDLIGIDMNYRAKAGENPSLDEYQGEFPELSRDEISVLTTRVMLRTASTLDSGDGIVRAAQYAPSSQEISTRFKKISEIGRGGMGSVWRAVQLSTGRQVALKELPADTVGSTAARARFEEEIHWASQLQHPNIARVYDSGLLEGSYFYAMELIDGDHLDVYAQKRRLTLRQMLELISMIAKAVQYAHERSIIHRDLKPSNVLVTPEGNPIIVDFGLACLARDAKAERKRDYGGISGTPAYMAPEQAMGRNDLIGRQTDVYSLGIIIYQFVTGTLPHSLNRASDEWRKQVSQGRICPASAINPGIGKDLNALIMKCLAINPQDRYSDAHQLADDIDRLLLGLELHARPLNFIGKVKSWCCRPARIQQAGNFSIAIGACLAPFHILVVCLAIAGVLGFSIPGQSHLRLREFIPLVTGFVLFDIWLFYVGFKIRQNYAWALWTAMATVIAWLSWFVLVLSGHVRFDTGGAVSSMAVRFPLYVAFTGIAAIGIAAVGVAIVAHYSHAFLEQRLRQTRQVKPQPASESFASTD